MATTLQQGRFATLLFDLLTPDEDAVDQTTREYRFDIALLSERLIEVIDWSTRRADIGVLVKIRTCEAVGLRGRDKDKMSWLPIARCR